MDQPITLAEMRAAGLGRHHVTFGQNAEDFLAQATTMEAIISPPWEVRRLPLSAAPNLKLLQSTSAGVDTLQPLDKIPAHIMIVNNRGTHAAKAGEYALMAILMLINFIPKFASDQRAERWDRMTARLASAYRLTVVGLGSLGGAGATQAKRMGMHVTGIRHSAAPHPACDQVFDGTALDEVLPRTDILLLAAPLTPATRNLISAERLALLPPAAGIINIGRGRLVDQDALLDALEAGRLAGAILDVFNQEPLPAGHRAWGVRNLIITPHMSSDNPTTYNAITLEIFARNLAAFEAGEVPPTAVDRAKGY